MCQIGLFLIGFLILFWLWLNSRQPKYSIKPCPISHLKLRLISQGDYMTGLVTWVPSVSPGIISQHIVIKIADSILHDHDLDPSVGQFSFDVQAGDAVLVELDAFNGVLRSNKAVATAVAPAQPESPTGLTIGFNA